jgi:anti-sigma factor (TIGR02949 family)
MDEDCRECLEKISEFMDGETDERTCDKIRAHIENSLKCQKCFESLGKTVDLFRQSPQERIPPDVQARLREMIEMCFSRSAIP